MPVNVIFFSMNIQGLLVLSSRWQYCAVLVAFFCGGHFHYPVCKADSVFGSDFREEPKSLMRSVGQSSWRWRGWSPHWGQIIMPRNVAVDGQIIMILRFLFHNVAKGTVFWNTVNKHIVNAVPDNTPKPSCILKANTFKSCISYFGHFCIYCQSKYVYCPKYT